MSGTVLVLEAVGISAAAVGVVLAQNPPEDLRAWWERQDWLHRMIMPMADPPDHADGLGILPWEDGPQPAPADDAGHDQAS